MNSSIYISLLVGLHLSTASSAQNIVSNGSFESTTCCPTDGNELWDTIGCVPDWFSPNNSSPDYFNQCSSILGVPDHQVGFQSARTGVAYAGALLYMGFDAREYVETRLNYPLISGRKYSVEFYVNLKNNCLYSVDAIGAHFSSDSLLNDTNSLYFPVIPQVENAFGSNVQDTLNWVRIYGEFIANGGEQYVTIGNFHSDFNTDIDTTSWGTDSRAYYYIEDVAVWDYDSTNSAPGHGFPQIRTNTLLRPGDFFIAENLPVGSNLVVFDACGNLVYTNENYENQLSADQFSSGLYIYEFILPDNSTKIGKLIIY